MYPTLNASLMEGFSCFTLKIQEVSFDKSINLLVGIQGREG